MRSLTKNYRDMTLLIVLLVIVSGYGFLLKLENWMAKRMIRAKDIFWDMQKQWQT